MVTKVSYRRQFSLSASAKLTLMMVTVMGFVGGWNFLARLEDRKKLQPNESELIPAQVAMPLLVTPTPWPTVAPLSKSAPIPTLQPTLTTFGQYINATQNGNLATQVREVGVEIMPALAPLPTLAPLPALPAPPPPPQVALQSIAPAHTAGS